MDDVRGKVAVVTGGASGIGKALATRLAAEGMHVVIADIEAPVLEASADELGVVGVRTDVADADSVLALRDIVLDRFGAVHVVCNNAGVGGGGQIKDLTLKDWKWVIDVSLWGVIHGIHAFLPQLLANEDGGHIVNTASVAGLVSSAGLGPYNAAKYGVVAISETLALELAAEGSKVGVSVLCPGLVRTNIFTSQRNRPQDLRNETKKTSARSANQDIADALLARGIDPSVAADRVFDAIRSGRLYVLTHPEYVAQIGERFARIDADADADEP